MQRTIAETGRKNRPLAIDPLRAINQCDVCGARARTVCSAVEDKDLARLSSIAVTMHVAPGHGFIEEGDSAEHFFNVTAGNAKLFKQLPDGRRQIVGFASLGHFLGLTVAETYAFSAEALDGMQICRFSRAKLRQLLTEVPAMEARILAVTANELVAAQEQMLLLGRKSARERLASFLVARLEAIPNCAGGAAPIDTVNLHMTRGDIADYLGLTVETVSRTFSQLTRDGLIAVPAPLRIAIRDRAALRDLATGMH